MYTLDEIIEFVNCCTQCELSKTRNNIVFGQGNPCADIMFIGEAPGYNEDLSGEAFIGRAGELLTKAINAIDMSREDIYIGNILKCRPPDNRDPKEDEIHLCLPYLRWQIKLIKPIIIVCLGRIAAKTLIDKNIRITQERGKWFRKGNFWIMPTFHPSAVLRDPSKKRPFWEDFKSIKEKYNLLKDS